MNRPSVPRCGRIDPHPSHPWTSPATHRTHTCPGHVVTEGGWPHDPDKEPT